MNNFNPFVKFDQEPETYEPGTLCCPGCGSIWTHHGATVVHNRPKEDDDTISISIKRNGDINVNGSSRKNPSERRSGVSIYFDCEFCTTRSELTIAQHKGQTQIRWREVPPNEMKDGDVGSFEL